jgi:hypothetical protein
VSVSPRVNKAILNRGNIPILKIEFTVKERNLHA